MRKKTMSIQIVTEKERRWQEIAEKCSRITDKLGQPVDSGIMETVIALNVLGIPTTQSCEGHVDYGICAPWIFFTSPGLHDFHEDYEQIARRHATDQRKILSLLEDFYAHRYTSHHNMLIVHRHTAGISILESQGARYQHRYLEVREQRAQVLFEYQQEMQCFTAFLKERFFAEEDSHERASPSRRPA